ncbi:homologous-pairing protein 2 homolog isoform X1 [Dendroctonus ponderosae]|uniref:Homologous-pairing protein 2 homolog n=1 Tax=Dendroctonus ponderosae TaxID=77166 RepID=U4U5D0_DENPD|nr:homologous-pairing protein 2 homolog isoform X1 [Dendroctonus ponderosae]XP_048518278.1 homologous-pairing protein 2 homolog isoform X1 [Dendroctonus ponderosae]ERL88272.1 hypothetical protein D910_05658 [Dendroctonus ponderosae]KAH1006604.1 hypothetical protein HUJ05_007319 [Dendroctonus ponderosae]
MAAEAVVDFFNVHNRPYSLSDIQEGLKSKFPKTNVQKAVNCLLEQGRIKEKVYGKQKVYFPAQNSKQSPQDLNDEIRTLDRQINEINTKVEAKEGAIKAIQAQYSERQGRLTLAEACGKKMKLDAELRTTKDALEAFDGVALVESKVKEQVQKEYERMLGIYRKRKRMCLDMLDTILESYPKKKANLYEEVGIETDEDAGFNLVL